MLQYSATLYNYSLHGKGGFYGRTYMSEPRQLVPSATAGGMLECRDEDFVFMHTNYTDKSSVLVVEIVITRDFNSQKQMCSGGFAVCNIFDFPTQPQSAIVQSGTPR